MRKWHDYLIALLLLGFGLFVVACLYGFGNVLNGDNLVITFWNLLINTLAS